MYQVNIFNKKTDWFSITYKNLNTREKPFIHTREIISTQDVARYVVLRIPPLVHLCQICIYLNTHYQKMDHKLI